MKLNRKSKQFSFEQNNKSKSQSKILNNNNSNFPQIEQSTQAQTFYSKNDTTLASIQKKIPRNILQELKTTDKDFFLTLQDPSQKSRRNNTSEQIKLKPLQRKTKEKEIDKIVSSVKDAVDKLRCNMKPEKLQINNISDSDSENDFGSLGTKSTKDKNRALAKSALQSKPEEKTKKYKNIIQEFPDPDQELGGISRIFKSRLNTNGTQDSEKIQSNRLYSSRQEQIKSFQATLQEGQKKHDNLIRLVSQKEQKLQELLLLIGDSDTELNKMQELNHIIHGSNSELKLNIEKNLSILENQRQYKESLKHMKNNKRKDLDLIKKRCDNLKKMNKSFESYLKQQLQTLIYDTKNLDQIRTQFQSQQKSKDQTEKRLEKQLKEHAQILQNEEEILQLIQQEQALQDQIQNQKYRKNQEKIKKNQLSQQEIKDQIDEQKQALSFLQDQFYSMKSQLNGSSSFENIIPQLQDLKGTNKFCKDKKAKIIQEMDSLRKQIQDTKQILFSVKCKQVEVDEGDQVAKEYEEIKITETQKQLKNVQLQVQKNKERDLFFKQTLAKIERGLKNMCSTLFTYNIPGVNNQLDLESKGSSQVTVEIIKGLRGVIQALEANKIDEKKIQEILFKKYKDMDHEDSFDGMDDIEILNSDSSDFSPSQQEEGQESRIQQI